MKGGSFFLSLGILLAIILGAWTGYNYWQNTKVDDQVKRLDKEIAQLQDELVKYEQGDVEETIIAKQKLDELMVDTIMWSEVIRDIQRELPTKKGKGILNILTYTGSGNRDLTLSLKTLPTSDNPYFDVADFIRAFDDSKYFIDGFVPSLAATEDEDGNPIISFNFSGQYVVDAEFQAVEVEEPESIEEVVEEPEEDEELEELLEAVEESTEEEGSVEETEELEAVIGEILEESLDTESTEETEEVSEEVVVPR